MTAALERTQAAARRLIGAPPLRRKRARNRSGCQLRVVERDGEGLAVTANLATNRIDIETLSSAPLPANTAQRPPAYRQPDGSGSQPPGCASIALAVHNDHGVTESRFLRLLVPDAPRLSGTARLTWDMAWVALVFIAWSNSASSVSATHRPSGRRHSQCTDWSYHSVETPGRLPPLRSTRTCSPFASCHALHTTPVGGSWTLCRRLRRRECGRQPGG